MLDLPGVLHTNDEVHLQQTLNGMCHIHLAAYDGDAIHHNGCSPGKEESLCIVEADDRKLVGWFLCKREVCKGTKCQFALLKNNT